MPRGPLSTKQKEAMQTARKKTQSERDDALEALETNPQFVNFKMWKKVNPALQEAVKKAITKAQKNEKLERIRKLQNEIDKIQGEL